jgi:hypothetical protein
MRGERTFLFANTRANIGVAEIAEFIEVNGGLATEWASANGA